MKFRIIKRNQGGAVSYKPQVVKDGIVSNIYKFGANVFLMVEKEETQGHFYHTIERAKEVIEDYRNKPKEPESTYEIIEGNDI